MTRILNQTPSKASNKRLFIYGFALLTLTALTAATTKAGLSVRAQQERDAWLTNAYQGYHNVKAFCSDRQVFGFQDETPPIVRFYLNEDGAFNSTFADWEIYHNGNRVVYQLDVQFQDFDDEMLTRIAELDLMLDDGDLFGGIFQLSMSGFTCRIPGPISTSEQFVGNFRGEATVNPI
ncbi:hypothetical protein [Cerasicoccus maritimus]|uniref:hypothetical protein n=1 Tax=Cerasicoccus maritimus TaxID=490089 RepID=UPI002852A848|nr:hypothetical protein [Cerasicoccus maritimus]